MDLICFYTEIRTYFKNLVSLKLGYHHLNMNLFRLTLKKVGSYSRVSAVYHVNFSRGQRIAALWKNL